uniref:Fork-head domain-containing protein n=1 Tax=Macrostomum lignano TaxID=282301 RepID=A0A1I8F1F8_9PLAT
MAECDNSLTTMDWLSAVDVNITPAKNELLESSLSLTNPSSSKHFEDFRPIERETGKPSHSYSTLIKFAISSTRSKRMSLRQIYKWITDNFPYYKDARNGWKNSIRHNLSLNKCFIKVPRDKGDLGKGCYWSLREGFRPESTQASSATRMPTITTLATNILSMELSILAPLKTATLPPPGFASFMSEAPQQAPLAASGVSGQDGLLTDSTVGALAALMGSQSDQVLGAAFAPESAGAQAPPAAASAVSNNAASQPAGSVTLSDSAATATVTTVGWHNRPAQSERFSADNLPLPARRILLGGSSGAFASIEIGGGGGSGGSGGSSGSGVSAPCQPPDLSASTLDFVQRMLPQLKDSFQLSDSALHDLWDHCRSGSRPPAAAESNVYQGGLGGAGPAAATAAVIPLPTVGSDVQRRQAQATARSQPPPPLRHAGATISRQASSSRTGRLTMLAKMLLKTTLTGIASFDLLLVY